MAFASAVVRSAFVVRTASSAVRAVGESRPRGAPSRSPARRCRGRACPGRSDCRPDVTSKRRVDRRVLDGLAQLRRTRPRRPGRRSPARSRRRRGARAARRSRQRGSFQRVAGVLEPHGGREREPRLASSRSQVGGIDLDRIDSDGKRNRAAALEPGERADDRCPAPPSGRAAVRPGPATSSIESPRRTSFASTWR